MGRYRIYQPVSAVSDTHGQVWAGESVPESIALCPAQTIEPVLLKYLPRNGKILESGCGLGRWVFYLRERGYDITGIDLAQGAIEQAKAYDPSAPLLLEDVSGSRLPDGAFDAAISLGVVEHFEEGPERPLAELYRLLKPDGLLFISVPVQNTLRKVFSNRLKDAYRWYRRRQGLEFVFEEYRYEQSEFNRLLQEAGFEILQVTPDDFRHPKNLGVYADLRFFRNRKKRWELNRAGKLAVGVLRAISPWTVCAGALWVCRKERLRPVQDCRGERYSVLTNQ